VYSGRVTFSILHPTARVPTIWQEASLAWRGSCLAPNNCEYILGVHERQRELPATEPIGSLEVAKEYIRSRLREWPNYALVVNEGEPNLVNNTNCCAAVADGKILLYIGDDLFPCASWDWRILEFLRDRNIPLDSQFVIKAVVGLSRPGAEFAEYHRGLITHPIISRAYQRRIGPIPSGYLGYGFDDEWTERAYRDGVVLEAPHIIFEHKHWSNGGRKEDAIDKHNGRQEAWDAKHKTLAARRLEGFR
jgi:hypothetical protein